MTDHHGHHRRILERKLLNLPHTLHMTAKPAKRLHGYASS
jgi:hypothetical protein